MAQKIPALIDTTLREGGQTAGLCLSLTVKKCIVAGLVAAGIDEIELGVANEECRDVKVLCDYVGRKFPQQAWSLWCRCRPADIRFAATLAPRVLSLSIPASDRQLAGKFGRGRSWALDRAVQAIHLARSLGIERVSLGLEDASRAHQPFLGDLARAACKAGAFRLRLADTVGIADPDLMAELVQGVAGAGLQVAVHCHNDFGMATANTMAAFGAGAQWGDVTLLGLGERAGNSRTEEVMAYLAIRQAVTKYKVAELLELCRRVARLTNQQITARRPLLGSAIFDCESGIHQHALLKEPALYEPYSPALVGGRRTLVMGAGSGRHALAAALDHLGLPRPTAADLHHLWQRMRAMATLLRRPLTSGELRALASQKGVPGEAGPAARRNCSVDMASL